MDEGLQDLCVLMLADTVIFAEKLFGDYKNNSYLCGNYLSIITKIQNNETNLSNNDFSGSDGYSA